MQRRGTAAFRSAPDGGAGSFLSGSTRNILLRCIKYHSLPCTAEEDIDGTVYTVEMIPHRGGALLAYLRRDRAAYDGSLRVIQDKSSRYLAL